MKRENVISMPETPFSPFKFFANVAVFANFPNEVLPEGMGPDFYGYLNTLDDPC
jgi:hypothetical protein